MNGTDRPVLVTGGAGFIGANLCRRLLADGHEVICIDNLSTGARSNIEELMRGSGFSFVEADVADPYGFEVSAIYNLACPASPPRYQADPVGTLKTSVLGAINALELAVRSDCPVLQASTSEVYGDPDVSPQSEEYRGNVNPIGPRACYDEGKRVAETLFFDYRRTRAARIKVVRIFNTYGPFMDPEDGRVVSNLITQALSGRSLTLYGDGTQTRSFCYVDDLVEGLIRMMSSPDEVVGPINLGNPTELTVGELASIVSRKVASAGPVVLKPLPADDPRQRRPSIDRAREELGWEPTVGLSEGLDRTIEYFRGAPRPAGEFDR